ncbi:hypothetical protein EVAR_24199_1 [Eumeta japonica]|uniref:Uncharacterized protein n=1 Tax=Eumeta variegata TaxID=151549 RepID=A0A4C1W3C6_EUMVA|nr:hypothetical protein EVAR_24199_1 [Eumeta japonica]
MYCGAAPVDAAPASVGMDRYADEGRSRNVVGMSGEHVSEPTPATGTADSKSSLLDHRLIILDHRHSGAPSAAPAAGGGAAVGTAVPLKHRFKA